jgi:hypothetical protein
MTPEEGGTYLLSHGFLLTISSGRFVLSDTLNPGSNYPVEGLVAENGYGFMFSSDLSRVDISTFLDERVIIRSFDLETGRLAVYEPDDTEITSWGWISGDEIAIWKYNGDGSGMLKLVRFE